MKLSPWVCSCLLAGLVLAGGNDPGSLDSAYRLSREGTQALLAGNAERAGEMYDRAVKLVADFPAAHLGIGHLAMSAGRYQEAFESYLAAIRGYEHLGDRILELERERYADTRAIIARLEQEIDADQRKLDTQLTRDHASAKQVSRLEARIRAYTAQVEQLRAVQFPLPAAAAGFEGAPGEAYFHLGNALFRMERYLDAAEAWRTSVERAPRFALVRYNLALVYLKLDRPDEAKASLAEAERLGYDVLPRVKARFDVSG